MLVELHEIWAALSSCFLCIRLEMPLCCTVWNIDSEPCIDIQWWWHFNKVTKVMALLNLLKVKENQIPIFINTLWLVTILVWAGVTLICNYVTGQVKAFFSILVEIIKCIKLLCHLPLTVHGLFIVPRRKPGLVNSNNGQFLDKSHAYIDVFAQ